MDSTKARSLALISIRPKFAARILSGSKRVEFRKLRFPLTTKTFLMYVTVPESAVAASFVVSDVEVGPVDHIWNKYQDSSGMEHSEFFGYYRGHEIAVGLTIASVASFPVPIQLGSLDASLVPPQGFRYLPSRLLDAAIYLSRLE